MSSKAKKANSAPASAGTKPVDAAGVNKSSAANKKVAHAISAITGKAKGQLSNHDGLSSGSLFLNYLFTGDVNVGYPYGKIIEVMGNEGCGKTTLAAHGVREAQYVGMPQHWTDAETILDAQWRYFELIGVDMESLPHTDSENPPIMEAALKDIMTILEMGAFCVIDSVPALQPGKQKGRDLGGGFQTARAALLSEALPLLRPIARRGKGILFCINQMRVDMNSGELKSSGGRALPYYADLRLKMSAWAMNAIKGTRTLSAEDDSVAAKHSDTKLGVTVVVDILKNRFHIPFKRGKVDIIYGKGIDKKKDIVYLGEYCGVVEKVTDKLCTYKGKNYTVASMSEELLQEILDKSKKVRF